MNQSYADMGLGCFYRWKTYSSAFFSGLVFREFYAGLSVPQAFTMDLSTPQDGEFALERIRHYYLITGGILQVSNKVLLEPSLWVRHVPNASFQALFNNAPLSGDFNCRLEYDYRFWAGVGASTNRLLHFEAGFNIGRGQYYNDTKSYIITLALTYDAPVGWNSWLGPSTEISVGIGWD